MCVGVCVGVYVSVFTYAGNMVRLLHPFLKVWAASGPGLRLGYVCEALLKTQPGWLAAGEAGAVVYFLGVTRARSAQPNLSFCLSLPCPQQPAVCFIHY